MIVRNHSVLFIAGLLLAPALLAGCSSTTDAAPDPDLRAALTEMAPTPAPTGPLGGVSPTALPTGAAQEATAGTPRSAPAEFSQPAVTFNPAYSESTPLQDTAEMFAILEALHQREFSGLTTPGWYLRYDLSREDAPDDDDLFFLVHVVDGDGHCQEQMAFFRKDGRVVPFLYRDADGPTGITYTNGESRILEVNATTCDLADMSSLGGGTALFSSMLEGYRNTLKIVEETHGVYGEIEFNAWFAHDAELGEVFIVQQVGSNIRQGVSIDPQTGESIPISSSITQDVYDLISGRPVRSWSETTLANGHVNHDEVDYMLEYYPDLPEDLQTAFDQAVAGLEGRLE